MTGWTEEYIFNYTLIAMLKEYSRKMNVYLGTTQDNGR